MTILAPVLALALLGAADEARLQMVPYEEYDRIKDETKLVMDLGTVNKNLKTAPVEATISAVYKGRGRKSEPISLSLMFVSVSKGLRFRDHRDIDFLVDDQRFKLSPTHRSTAGLDGITEVLVAEIRRSEAKLLADGLSNEGRLGDTDIRLNGSQPNAVGHFLYLMDSPELDPNKMRSDAEAANPGKGAKDKADREALAADLLEGARELERTSKTVFAKEAYRNIISFAPGTQAAKQAAARLDAMTKAAEKKR